MPTMPSDAADQRVRYAVDPMHTFVTFEVLHFGTSTVRARFDTVDGHLDFDPASGDGQGRIVIDTQSVSSGIARFDTHLRSAQMLNCSAYPVATYTVDGLQYESGKLVTVQGKLSLLGQTHALALHCRHANDYDSPLLQTHVRGGDFETTIKRSRWGMDWGLDLGIPDDVRLVIQVELAQEKAA